ncbi:hypothetical protein BKA67DRAFT_527378 [Truncatella angustata]|uniref:Galactose oxidase n=1 Tax=Truncatella angustata TaxID=152316 RepID=A0A9P8RF92_9PEZI|nr:uncharacterized protein BKA67DRAFT_527378 [Truncatella angustata]KAH6644928.1 hypothetical protein BKA67DRAFT_527378 [Truncatella angustata]KAH8204242.1 hypothetical protein TruAng_001528 [Truncatella angustata]
MAEVAAGAIAAEQVLSTTIEAGAASYAVGKPSNGLKVTLNQLATAAADGTSNSLVRSNHTLTVVGDRAYIFGGQTDSGKIATNDIHSFALPTADEPQSDYHLTPAISFETGTQVPAPRTGHSACALGGRLVVFGGLDESGKVLQEETIWLYDPQKSAWKAASPASSTTTPSRRSKAKIFPHGENLLLYGGNDEVGTSLTDVWEFDFSSQTWARLPNAPVSTTSAAFAEGSLYLIAATDGLSSVLYHLDIASQSSEQSDEPPTWVTTQFPTNPLVPGPRPRENGGLLHVTTGFGRSYLLYFLGDRQPGSLSETSTGPPLQWSDIWSLQLPASQLSVQRTTTISEAIKPAKIKDAIRSRLGYDTGTFSWAEAEVAPPGDLPEPEGKVHPGPRSSFGCDVLANKRDVVLWGGINAKGEREGDGWIIHLQ